MIYSLRAIFPSGKRVHLQNKLRADLDFRLRVQRHISKCFRLLEQLMDQIKQPNHQLYAFKEHFQVLYNAIRDGRNYQTHDLWRQDDNRTINTYLLINRELPATLLTLERLSSRSYSLVEGNAENDLLNMVFHEKISFNKFISIIDSSSIDVNAQDHKGRTLLHFLAESDLEAHKKMANALIDQGCNIHLPDYEMKKPLHYACECGNIFLIKLLIENGAIPDSPSIQGTPIHVAQYYEYEESVGDIEPFVGITRSTNAAALLDSMMSLNLKNITSLFEEGVLPCLEFNGRLPFVELFRKNWADEALVESITVAFIKAGACVEQQESYTGDSALHTAAENFPNIYRVLLQDCPNIDLTNSSGETPLYIAVKSNHLDLAELLLQNNALVDEPNSMGWTPLMLCCKQRHRNRNRLIKLLLRHGANPNVSDEYGSALHQALDNGHNPDALLHYGASPFAIGKSGNYMSLFPHQIGQNRKAQFAVLEKALEMINEGEMISEAHQKDFEISFANLKDKATLFL